MTKYYLIIPCVLLLGFFVFHQDFEKKLLESDQVEAAMTHWKKVEKERHLALLRQKTAEEARERATAHEHTERERAEKRRHEADVALQKIVNEADLHRTTAGDLAREVASMETKVTELRGQKEQFDHDVFELTRNVEEHRIDRRLADLEIQRTTKMVAARLQESDWANPTPVRAARNP